MDLGFPNELTSEFSIEEEEKVVEDVSLQLRQKDKLFSLAF